jgi:NADPH:quinone reductase-like Zn-dependent oxidoreductase
MGLVFGGKLQPIVDRVYPMNDFRTALARMMENQHFGKILIQIA